MTSSTGHLRVRVAAKVIEALDVCSFELVSCDGKALPSFGAGSHVDVQVSEALTRQYSLCNDPSEDHRYLIAVLRDASTRGGSQAMHDRVQVGDVLTISTPKNHFPLAHEARRSLLLAGGIGVTPILCMAERLALTGAVFEMHYASRTPERTAFVDRIRSSAYAENVHFHFDDGPPEQRFDGERLLADPDQEAHLYVCGPKGFMDHVLALARANGWPEDRLHYEFFGAQIEASGSDSDFQVQVASTGKIVTVSKGQTVIEALSLAGIHIETSCEQGVCGTCLTRVLEGVPDHKDLYLSPQEQASNAQFMPCCSRSKSDRLVLDL